MAGNDRIRVEVAYARPDRQLILPVELDPGATLLEAVHRSGILDEFPEIDPERAKMGIFGKLARKDQPLRQGDRVEIYRSLIADPKEVRRQRAREGRTMRRNGGPGPADDKKAGRKNRPAGDPDRER